MVHTECGDTQYMWISEMEICSHAPCAERRVYDQDTKKKKGYGDTETVCFTLAMYIAEGQE